ncbi:hypothetical protein CFK37_07340 [Virgibacillus phasianinus]|uniref:DUF3899 domain-containing protein n=1 Tax=Virgibacillus phasianinus TaxID=2017483 RepID=A0A220U1R5_9BACI|nr:DUF3899 domain-containing protein [Virgibacillus phasianinus]ASK61985.1 hypothetical protein CFK37_07340 [Virgibacillus phasianinus]
MVYIKNKWIFLLFNVFIGFVILLLSTSPINLRFFIDSLFYVTIVYIILMLLLFIIRGRFFDGIIWSFRRFGSIMSKNRDYLEEAEGSPKLSERINLPFYRFIAFQTFALLIILVLLLILYYM